jgi:hypothetical protein
MHLHANPTNLTVFVPRAWAPANQNDWMFSWMRHGLRYLAESRFSYPAEAMKDTDRKAALLKLWLVRPSKKRTRSDLLKFYGELEQSRPELLKRRHGDPYQQLKVDLRGHILEP